MTTYWLRRGGNRNPWRKVTIEEWCRAELLAGFDAIRSRPSTFSFWAIGDGEEIEGVTTFDDNPPHD